MSTKTITNVDDLYTFVQDNLQKLLSPNDHDDEIEQEHKTNGDLLTDHLCCNATDNNIYNNCHSIKRINIILIAFTTIINSTDLCNKISLSEVLRLGDTYGLVQIKNDFIHIKDHLDKHKTIAITLRTKFRNQLWYTSHTQNINQFRRRRTNCHFFPNMQDNIFLNELNTIFTYLTFNETDINCHYAGKREDEKWLQSNIKQHKEHSDELYVRLVKNMGCFRKQLSHGFNYKQHHSLMHLRPKWQNVKEEALYNPYCCLSKDNWNQTLRKAAVFYKSFARQRIKTADSGKYEDNITQHITQWKQGESVDLGEIVVFKLYTDFDKLQYELKKCFRFESTADIFALNNLNDEYRIKFQMEESIKRSRFLLEERLCHFFNWRIKLVTVLSKYSRKIDTNMRLYHGVNAKMIINHTNASTAGLAFSGPLSTTESYHVATTFATAKGMVLEVTSQFPKLGHCKAFNVSLISDYPEEKEHLISFAYLRIKKVFTRPLSKKWKTFNAMDECLNEENVPVASKMRSIFFAVHLFLQEIFCMSVNCEYWLSAFLYLCCCYNELENNKDNQCIKRTIFVDELEKLIINCKCSGDIQYERFQEILCILWNKFEDFRKCPNKKQVIKMDEISDNLKGYFMDHIGFDIYNNNKWIISFEKIAKIFVNMKEIHFMNVYTLDVATLNNLITFLENNLNSKIQTIKFLFYDDKDITVQKTKLNEINASHQYLINKLEDMNWLIKHKNILNTGFEIKLFCNKKWDCNIAPRERSNAIV